MRHDRKRHQPVTQDSALSIRVLPDPDPDAYAHYYRNHCVLVFNPLT